MTRRHWLIAAFLALAAGGHFAQLELRAETSKSPPVPAAGIARLQATVLPDASGKATPVGAWKGKVLVVNFWATWCPPCRKEMPAFSRLQGKFADKGVQFVGIGIDSASAIKEYAYQSPVSYPLLIAGSDGLDLIRALGNQTGALPYTVILDRQAQPVFSRLGVVEEGELETLLKRLSAP